MHDDAAAALIPAPPELHWLHYARIFVSRRGALLPVVEGLLSRYGETVRVRLGRQTVCLETNAATIAEILVKQAGAFQKNQATLDFRGLIGDGLLTSSGERWQQHRRLISPIFFRQSLRQMIDLTKRQLPKEIAAWTATVAKQAASTGHGLTVDLRSFTHTLMLSLSAGGLFGVWDAEAKELIGQVIGHFIERSSGSLLVGPLKQRLRRRAFDRLLGRMNRFIYGLMAERRRLGHLGDDFLGALMRLQVQEGAEHFSDVDIRDEAFTMLGASHDTLSTTLAWALFALAGDPVLQDRLAAEEGDHGPVAGQVLQETMRLYPPAWIIGREALHAVDVGRYQLAKGDSVLIPITLLHRDPRFWPDPGSFKPERFSAGATYDSHYLPFGLGPRACIGQGLALWQGKAILQALSKAFRLARVDQRLPQPEYHIIMRPPAGLRAQLMLRG